MTNQRRECMTCRHAGMDMDMSPYCAHPETVKIRPYGSNLCRPDPARDHCGPEHNAWEQDDHRTGTPP